MEELIRRAKNGDQDALGHIWRTYQHLLVRYFRGRGMSEPEDLCSNVWIEVARSLKRFDGGEDDFRRWLFTIASRTRIDEIRASTRRKDRNDKAERLNPTQTTAADTADVVDRQASLDRAVALVSTLPPDQAEAVMLRIVGEMNVAEIAAIMGRSEGSVRVLVHRGLKKLSEKVVTP